MTTDTTTRQAAVLAYIIELHLQVPDGPERRYWERSAALTAAELGGLLPAARNGIVSLIQRHTSGARRQQYVVMDGRLDMEQIEALAAKIVAEAGSVP